MPKHAYLSASASHRWLACPPSAKLCASINDSGSPYAQQGTDAHALCEYKVEKLLGRDPNDPTENLTYFDTEMADCTDEYASYVMKQVNDAKQHCSDPLILIEEKLDFSKWVPEGFGTGDCVIVADDVLHIIDFKYGLGVLVDATENPQMMCYALGALDTFDGIYDIQTIRLTIFQPRRENISTYEISKADLMKWAEEVLKPTAELAYNGEGEYNAGDHCQFCKAKATCRKRAEHNLELAQYDFDMPPNLDDAEIAAIIGADPVLTRQKELLKSIDGIGERIAVNMIAITGGFTRFQNARQFCSFAGLTPYKYDSGTSVHSKVKVSKRANQTMKALLHLSAVNVATRMKEGEYKDYYERKLKEGKHVMCIMNVLRAKLVHRMFSVIRRNEEYTKQYKPAS